MKIMQKTWAAWLCTAVMVVAAVAIGLSRGGAGTPAAGSPTLDSSLPTGQYRDYILDEAGVLDQREEEAIALYNANWVARYDSLIAVAAVPTVEGDIADYAYELGTQIQLAAADGILVLNTADGNCYLAAGPDYPLSDGQITAYLDRALYEPAMAGRYGEGVLALFAQIDQFYVEEYGLGGAAVVMLLYLIILYRVGVIVRRCTRTFPAILVTGLGLCIVFQALINMGVCVGLFPVTGQPLPLVSMGGTSLIFTSAMFGMILSVSHTFSEEGEREEKARARQRKREEMMEGEEVDAGEETVAEETLAEIQTKGV